MKCFRCEKNLHRSKFKEHQWNRKTGRICKKCQPKRIVCTACQKNRHNSMFSQNQLNKTSGQKCKECIARIEDRPMTSALQQKNYAFVYRDGNLDLILPHISSRLETVIQLCQDKMGKKILQRIDKNRHKIVGRKGLQIFIPRSAVVSTKACKYLKHHRQIQIDRVVQRLDWIDKFITFFEMKEGLVLFELAVWKANKDQAGDLANHDDCRGLVKNCIEQYLLGTNSMNRYLALSPGD